MLDHRAYVIAFAQRMGPTAPNERILVGFELAFDAIWQRARISLGDITLTAIGNRVLHSAIEQYPALSALKVSGAGLDVRDLHLRVERFEPQALREGLCFVLVEMLTVIGKLTSEILTSALHAALATVLATDGSQETDGLIERKRTHDS
jgi:hypothetical protein